MSQKRLSAHAKLCLPLTGVDALPIGKALDRIERYLTQLNVPIVRTGPAPSAESIWNELRDRAVHVRARRRTKSSSVDRFVLSVWGRLEHATRARCLATATSHNDTPSGDLSAREFARQVRDMLTPIDLESFLDEMRR